VRLADLGRSTFFRFSLALTTAFLVAYMIAGLIAFRAINTDLRNRVIQSAELASERYEDTFQESGSEGLIDAVKARARVVDADDEFVWIGSPDGATLVGQEPPDVTLLATGQATGADLGADPQDQYWFIVRDFGDLRLITGRSFEESDAIGQTVLTAFGGATLLILLLSGFSAALLARRGQQRLERISATLTEVSLGNLKSRAPLSGSADDLDRLSVHMNEALFRLETTVEGIRQVSVNIAHDLRTPISRLGIRLEEILDEVQDQPELGSRLRTASSELKQITTTFDSLLRIAQIEAGARKSRFRPVALPGIGAALQEAYLPVAEEKQQQLTFKIASAATALVYGDQDLLTQLFANLLENSIHHAPSGAHIVVEVGSDEQGVWMCVTDDGPGIPPSEYANVTKRFYRLDSSRNTPGSGLGLALVKAIADLHGAELQLKDSSPGLTVRLIFDRYEQRKRSPTTPG
jgi:signal transduction histidine kinase